MAKGFAAEMAGVSELPPGYRWRPLRRACDDADLNFARIRTKAAAGPAPVAPVAPPRARPGTSKGKGTGKGAGKGKAGPC